MYEHVRSYAQKFDTPRCVFTFRLANHESVTAVCMTFTHYSITHLKMGVTNSDVVTDVLDWTLIVESTYKCRDGVDATASWTQRDKSYNTKGRRNI